MWDAPVVVAALIAGGVAMTSPIITFIVTKAYEKRFLERMPKGRQKALTGKWSGVGYQEIGPDGQPLDAKLSLDLIANGKTVTGTGDYTFRLRGTDYHIRIVLDGGFFHDRFLKLDYKNADNTAVQFGAIITELSSEGRTLRGYYVGYGAISERPVCGTLEVQKQA